jgi:hypothetical protein
MGSSDTVLSSFEADRTVAPESINSHTLARAVAIAGVMSVGMKSFGGRSSEIHAGRIHGRRQARGLLPS